MLKNQEQSIQLFENGRFFVFLLRFLDFWVEGIISSFLELRVTINN